MFTCQTSEGVWIMVMNPQILGPALRQRVLLSLVSCGRSPRPRLVRHEGNEMPTDPNQKILEAKVIQWGPGHGVAVKYGGNKVEEYYIGTKEDAKEEVQLLSGKKLSYGP